MKTPPFATAIFFTFWLASTIPAGAQPWPTMDIIDTLSFGEFAVRNNDAQHRIVIDSDGTFAYDPAIIGITDPVRGEYFIEDLPADTAIGINVTNGTLSNGGGPAFSITDFTHNSPVTNPAGQTTLYLGATLRTSGSGQNYNSGNYTGTIDISVDY